MKLSMIATLALATLVGGYGIAQHSAPMKERHMMNSGDLKWGPAPPGLPKGATVTVLAGDPGKEGLFTLRAKMPAGYTVRPHWHSNAEHVTVLEGQLSMALSSKLDMKMAQALRAGGYAVMPAKTNHFAVAGKHGATIQVTAMGPFDIHYVNPADDPRNPR